MNTSQAVSLGQELDVVRHTIATVLAAVRAGLVRNLEKAVDLLLIDANTSSELRQSGVSLVASLVDDADVEVIVLLVEERFAELPELVGAGLEDSGSCFVHQSRRRVPWLDLVSEDELDLIRVFGLDQGND